MSALPPPAEDVVVLARNPTEVLEAQGQLLTWADSRVSALKVELEEAEDNLAQAKKLKIRTQPWAKQVTKASQAVVYYEKLRLAIAAGYYIVPNFPVHVIAVRTSRARPSIRYQQVETIKADLAPSGEGQYVSPQPLTEFKYLPDEQRMVATSAEFQAFDFPFRLVKPQILSDLSEALKLGLFDEIGVFPAPPGVQQTKKAAPQVPPGDPMVVGIIKQAGQQVSFLITWWIDTRDL
jgi:hypothetical protein